MDDLPKSVLVHLQRDLERRPRAQRGASHDAPRPLDQRGEPAVDAARQAEVGTTDLHLAQDPPLARTVERPLQEPQRELL